MGHHRAEVPRRPTRSETGLYRPAEAPTGVGMKARLALLVSVPLVACGDPGSGPGPRGGSSEGSVTAYLAQPGAVVRTGLGLTVRHDGLEGEDVFACDAGAGQRGVCLTPHQVRGWAGDLNLSGAPDTPRPVRPDGTPEPSPCGPGRLLALNGFTDSGGPARGGGVFDLGDPRPVGGNTALFCEEYLTTQWRSVSVKMTYLDAQLRMPGGYWTVRWLCEPTPARCSAATCWCAGAPPRPAPAPTPTSSGWTSAA